METVVYNTLKYLIEFIKLFIFAYYILELEIKKSKKTFLILGMSFVFTAAISIFFDIDRIGISYGLILIISMFFVLKEKEKIILLIFSYVLICIIDMITCITTMYVLNISYNQLEASRILQIALNSVSIIVILIVTVLNRIFGKNKKFENTSLKHIGLMIIGSLAVAFYMTYVVISVTNSEDKEELLTAIVFGLSGIIFVVVCILLMYNKSKNEQLKYETEMMSRLVKSQEAYYTMLLKKEEETKQFRHDIRNHLYCMQTLFENRDYDELKKYFEKMNANLKELSTETNTGSSLVNVILNELKSIHSDVACKWSGQIDSEIKIDQMDLCIIFSNLLSNAFEAAEKCDNKWVNVEINMFNSNLHVKVLNAAIAAPEIIDGNFVSAKQDDGHGYGVKNIKKSVEKYRGSFESSYDNGVFRAEIVILK